MLKTLLIACALARAVVALPKAAELDYVVRRSVDADGDSTGAGLVQDPGIFPGPLKSQQFSVGWKELPQLPGAKIDNETFTVGNEGAVITTYIDADYDPSKIKRAVVQIHGEYRDAWNQWMYSNISANNASKVSDDINRDEIVILAPMFFSIEDQGAYPVDKDGVSNTHALIWNRNGWGDTQDALYPMFDDAGKLSNQAYNFTTKKDDKENKKAKKKAKKTKVKQKRELDWDDETTMERRNLIGISNRKAQAQGPHLASLDALDAYVAYFTDKKRFPVLNTLVIAGFSMGGQAVNRYVTFRKSTEGDNMINYWISSPASYMYLNDTRPVANPQQCKGYDDYKYGLQGNLPPYFNRSSVTVNDIINRYLSRKVFYFVGSEDSSSGDRSCQAKMQGNDHVDRMQNWVDRVLPYLPNNPTPGKLPDTVSANVIDGVQHSAPGVIFSTAGMEALFMIDYNGRGQDAKGISKNAPKPGKDNTKTPQLNGAAATPDARTLAVYVYATAVAVCLLLGVL